MLQVVISGVQLLQRSGTIFSFLNSTDCWSSDEAEGTIVVAFPQAVAADKRQLAENKRQLKEYQIKMGEVAPQLKERLSSIEAESQLDPQPFGRVPERTRTRDEQLNDDAAAALVELESSSRLAEEIGELKIGDNDADSNT